MKTNIPIVLSLFVSCLAMIGCDTTAHIETESPIHDCEDVIFVDDVSEQESEAQLHKKITDLFAPKYSQTELDSAIAYLVDKQGFDPEKFDARDWGITYDGDLGLPVDDILDDMRGEGEVEMRGYVRQPYLVTNTNSIRVATIAYGSFALPSSWFQATNNATFDWHSLGGDLNFSRRHYAHYYSWVSNLVWIIPVDFSLYVFLNDDAIAQTHKLTSNGLPSKIILLNSDHPQYVSWSANEKKQVILHEIGHAIGFFHTDAYTSTGIDINGLSASCMGNHNDDSIMRAKADSSTNCDFTSCDVEAYHKLY